MIELTAALVGMVALKATHVVKHEFTIVHQRQPAGCCIAKELVAKAAEDAGDEFGLGHYLRTL